MSAPDWKDAPEWARWVAQDKDARWWWYENKPSCGIHFWSEVLSGGRVELVPAHGAENWPSSLQERPA